LELRAGQLEARLTEIQGAIAAVDHSVIDPDDVAVALAQFNPFWDALSRGSRPLGGSSHACDTLRHSPTAARNVS
jgi:hypothetical protein